MLLQTLSAILSHTPLWVWALLVALVALGLVQARTQVLAAPRLVALPLAIGAWSLASAVASFAAAGPVLVAAAWIAGAALGLASNRGFDLPRRCEPLADGRYRIEGSLAPLALMIGVFVIRYVNGVSVAMHPPLAATTGYVVAASLAFGFPAGLLAARARKVLGRSRDRAAAAAW
jgi:hypothetical protein